MRMSARYDGIYFCKQDASDAIGRHAYFIVWLTDGRRRVGFIPRSLLLEPIEKRAIGTGQEHFYVIGLLGHDMDKKLTCYGRGMACTLATGDEDDIALARIGIVVLLKKEFVDAIFLKSCDLDKGADGSGQTTLKNQVLLATNLRRNE